MATTKPTKTKRKRKQDKKITARVSGAPIDLAAAKVNSIEMQGDRLVVRISRTSHPEIFDIDKLIKQLAKVRQNYEKRRKMRDLTDFLGETEKSLTIILSNHLEVALRKYLT